MASSKAEIRASRARVAAYNRMALLGEEITSATDPIHDRPNPTSRVSPMWTTATRIKATDSKASKPSGWDKVVTQFNEGGDFSRVQRSSEIRPEFVAGFTGADNGSGDDATPMRQRLIVGKTHVPTTGKGTSKSDRNDMTFMDNGGSLRPLMEGRTEAIIPDGLTLGWRYQNTTVKVWR